MNKIDLYLAEVQGRALRGGFAIKKESEKSWLIGFEVPGSLTNLEVMMIKKGLRKFKPGEEVEVFPGSSGGTFKEFARAASRVGKYKGYGDLSFAFEFEISFLPGWHWKIYNTQKVLRRRTLQYLKRTK